MNFDGPVPGIPGAAICRVGKLPDDLPNSVAVDPHSFVAPGQVLLRVPGHGCFLSRNGQTIELTVEPAADPGVIALYLNGSARGALIHQRGELPLHAATLLPPGGGSALAICGPSGAGKSTLAAELIRRGWVLVADDSTRVSPSAGGVIAWPSCDRIKLWRDSCEIAGIDVTTLERVTKQLDKYYWRVAASVAPVPLGTVIELTLEGQESAAALTAGEKMALITRNTYRPAYIRPLGVANEHVRVVAQTVAACRMFRMISDRSVPIRAFADNVECAVG